MKLKLIIFFLFLLLMSSLASLLAQDEFDFEDKEKKEETSFEFKDEEEKKKGFSFPLRGKINLESARQINDPRWIRLGPSILLILDYNSPGGSFYSEITGRYNRSFRMEEDSPYIRRHYEIETILRELYWKKNFGSFTLSAGNFMTVWGKADILPVTDAVSVLDRTEAFFANPEEIRLGQNTIKLEYFSAKSETSMLVVPYPRFDRITDRDHPYSYAPGMETKNKDQQRKEEFGIRHNRMFDKGSISFMTGWFNNREPIFLGFTEDSGKFIFLKKHEPFWYSGTSFNIAIEPILIKAEFAFNYKRPQQKIAKQTICASASGCREIIVPDGIMKKNQANLTLGLDYNTGDWGFFIIESSLISSVGKDPNLAINKSILFNVLGVQKNFLHEELKVSSFIFFLDGIKNLLFRFQFSYNFTDIISISSKYTGVFIETNDPEYEIYEDYDRFDFSLSYDFDLK